MADFIEVTRTFNAPVELVWQLWTNPELVKRWWGPKHFSSAVAKINFGVGLSSVVNMLAPTEMGGREYFSRWEYTEILPMQKIEFIQNLCDCNGKIINPVSVGMPEDFPKDIRTLVTFKQLAENKTEMTITEFAEFGSIGNFAKIGLEQSMDKMQLIYA